MKLKVGFHQDFQDPTLLFAGETVSLKEFAKLLKDWSKSPVKNLQLKSLELFNFYRNVSVSVTISSKSEGLKVLQSSDNGIQFGWILSPESANNFAELVSALAESPHGHQYLEYGTQ